MTARDLHRAFFHRPLFRLELSGSHRPTVAVDDGVDRRFRPLPVAAPAPVPLWLRELRRDTREQVL